MFVIKRANKFLTASGEWLEDSSQAFGFDYVRDARYWAKHRNMDDAIIVLR